MLSIAEGLNKEKERPPPQILWMPQFSKFGLAVWSACRVCESQFGCKCNMCCIACWCGQAHLLCKTSQWCYWICLQCSTTVSEFLLTCLLRFSYYLECKLSLKYFCIIVYYCSVLNRHIKWRICDYACRILFSTCIIQKHTMPQWDLQNNYRWCTETSKPISYVVCVEWAGDWAWCTACMNQRWLRNVAIRSLHYITLHYVSYTFQRPKACPSTVE